MIYSCKFYGSIDSESMPLIDILGPLDAAYVHLLSLKYFHMPSSRNIIYVSILCQSLLKTEIFEHWKN